MVSDQSYRVVRFFHVLLSWLWNKLYDGIEVHHVETVKDLAKTHEVVYIPCHRSHIDYLLLSFVLYHNGLTPPHIAAGKNLNLPIVGPMLRRGGAFFMRRSFQGDTLYKTIFDEYLHLMFVRGYSVEYFIEGSRSRTGRTLTPRTGMLSMTMRSFQRDASRPMALMPVYFSYERILEAPTYMSELAGRDKRKESTFDIFRIFGALKHSFGKVAVSFGSPVLLADFLDEKLPEWRDGRSDTKGFSETCVQLSHLLATRINGAAVVNPVNLVATALLATPRQTMEIERLGYQVNILRDIASGVPDITVTPLDASDIVDEARKIAGVTCHQDGGLELVTADRDVTILLTYYRNNTAHVFAMQSLIARIVRTFEQVGFDRLATICQTLYPYLKAEFFLRWQEDEIPALCRTLVDLMSSIELIEIDGRDITIPSPESESFAGLSELAEIIQPTLERFFIVANLLESKPDITIKEVETAAAATSRQLSVIYGINSPDFFERSLFSTFIATLRDRDVIAPGADHIDIRPAFEGIKEAAATTLRSRGSLQRPACRR
ncbi:MAG: glycerol-3-phosphate 1-O-acyltransferase PlsB [Gammaproteobacteria bacterium]|nr:glycerol-3-phosphate 1-O-acyltransferase PlsB [Gammaproteobacteria bacterium]